MSEINRNTQAIFYNLNQTAIQRMLDYDYLIGRDIPSVAVVVQESGTNSFAKFFFGAREILIPTVRNLAQAVQVAPQATVLVNFASLRSAPVVVFQAFELPQIKLIHIFAEGIPERVAREMYAHAKKSNKLLIGPASIGVIFPGKFKTGHIGGTTENIIQSKLTRPGSVGLITRSGGLFNELGAMIGRETDGLAQGVAIGGDRFAGSFYLEHLLNFEQNPEVAFSVILGEVGGTAEYDVIEAIKNKRITKPVIAYCIGGSADEIKTEVQFGHAGAVKNSNVESAIVKNQALSEVCIVPKSFDELTTLIREVYLAHHQETKKSDQQDINHTLRPVPLDLKQATKQGLVRTATHFTSSISNDTGSEVTYAGIPLSQIINQENGYTFVDVICLLWFKRRFPSWASIFMEKVLMTIADHGPLVSGAHNSIIAARAGKDVVSSLASGLLTIGPRFGGAIDGAASYFKKGHDEGMTPQEFVNYMRKIGIPIPGIGHKIKSIRNPDLRVQQIISYARENFKSTEQLDYALQVETVTTAKRENLILNVDGTIACLFIDMWKCLGYSDLEITRFIEIGVLNSFFILGRSTGLIGHILDQKRLGEGLYRHPQDDVLYID